MTNTRPTSASAPKDSRLIVQDLVCKHKSISAHKLALQGSECGEDVSECETYAGTDLGCQNGATCEELHGTFRCHCPPGFHGYRCQSQSDTCGASGAAHGLCGPSGTCVPQPGAHVPFPSHRSVSLPIPRLLLQPAFKCICDAGFAPSPDAANPACEDVDECASSPCYPGVDCVNRVGWDCGLCPLASPMRDKRITGDFRCGSCPPGLRGNGVQCWDVDECLTNNGGSLHLFSCLI